MHKSSTFLLFEEAIRSKKQIACTYQGYYREICPHVVGWGSNGEQALVFQFAGDSSKGLPAGGDWRCLILDLIKNAQTRDGEWFTGSGHSSNQTCVTDIAIEVEY